MTRVIGNLSLLGFLDGITATGIVLFAVCIGLFSIYKAKKVEAKMLSKAGLMMIFIGCFYLGPATDFFCVLLTGNNLSPTHLYAWLSYIWIAPGVLTFFYLGAELMVPDKKWIIIGIYAVLVTIFEILIFSMPTEVFQFNPNVQEGDLLDSSFNRANLAFYLIVLFLVSVLVFLVFGFGIKALKATGEIRKKFAFLSLGSLIFFICSSFDALFLPGIYLVFWRGAMMTYALWMYLGLKT